jgi:hypothetical protein
LCNFFFHFLGYLLNKRAKKTSGKNKEKISSENAENLRQGGEGVGGVVEVIHRRKRNNNFASQTFPSAT